MSTNDLATALQDPIAQELLSSTNVAHLSYTWSDGTPRVIPIWFHWDGSRIVMAGPIEAPRSRAIKDNSPVAIVIDSNTWPYHVLSIRGTAHVDTSEGVAPEYAAAAERYFGPEQGKGWVDTVRQLAPAMTRIAVTPEFVSILDFEKRWPSAIARAMAMAGAK